MRHSQELRQQSLHKLVSQARMLAQLFKISKISLGQVKRMRDQYQKMQNAIIQQKIYKCIADAMLGKDFKNEEVRNQKIKDIKQGKYNNLVVTLYPSQIQDIGSNFQTFDRSSTAALNSVSAKIDQIKYSLFELFKQKQSMQQKTTNLQKQAIKRVQQNGIVFLDQIDKLTTNGIYDTGKSISREGVQRDLLPLIEGTMINTKIGDVNTDNILFIACGSFSMSKVQDLIPQLLGRLPIRVDMSPITQQQFLRILTQPKYNLLMQQKHLLQQEQIELQYTPQSISQIARVAYNLNMYQQNIGARRLNQVTEKIIEDVSFNCVEHRNQRVVIDAQFVKDKVKDLDRKFDIGKYLI